MFFTSYSFIIFLSIIFLLYYLIPKRLQWPLLLIASYIFYGFAGIKYFTYIVLTTISTYIVGLKIGNLYKEESKYLKENKGILSRVELKEYGLQVSQYDEMAFILYVIELWYFRVTSIQILL